MPPKPATVQVVRNAAELNAALANPQVKTVKLFNDIPGTTFTAKRLVDVDLNGYTLTGNVNITTSATGTINLTAGTGGEIIGNLTVNAPAATVNNNIPVQSGVITITDVALGTWNESAVGNSFVINDKTGVIFNVKAGGEVAKIEVTAAATGDVKINNEGIIQEIQADATVDLENKQGAAVNKVTGSAQVEISGEGKDDVTNIENPATVDLEAAKKVSEKIAVLTGKYISDGFVKDVLAAGQDIETAKTSYDTLNDNAKGLVTDQDKTTLDKLVTGFISQTKASISGLQQAISQQSTIEGKNEIVAKAKANLEIAKILGLTGTDLGLAEQQVNAGEFTIALEKATSSVKVAETSKLKADKDAAQALVTELKDSQSKTDLQNRLNAIQLLLEAPVAGLKTLDVNEVTEDGALFLVAGLGENGGTAQVPSTLTQVKESIDRKYSVNFNAEAIVVSNGKIEITGSVLSTGDWDKIKTNGVKTEPYRITLVKDGSVVGETGKNSGKQVAKVAMYQDGNAVLEAVAPVLP